MEKIQITAQEIKLSAKQSESFTVEFKKAVPSKVRELSEEICAFANSEGGIVFVGITDDGQICGCDIKNSKRSAIQNSINEISPVPECDFYSVEVDDKNVWIIEVKTSDEDKPYFVSGAVYVRQNANSQKLTDRDMVRKMFTDSVQISFDKISVKDYDLLKNIDRRTMKEFRLQSGISDVVSDQQILENLSLFNKEGLSLNAGIMFFDENQSKKFIHTVVRCVMFKGTDKVHIIDDKTFDGSLLNQYLDSYKWLQSKIAVKYEMQGFGPRKEIWELPLEALKEALLNAICHRDYYDEGANVMVEVYDDRVTITNPGGVLPIVQKNFGHMSKSRNPLIFGMFTRMHLVEKVGSGIPRMKSAMLDLNLSEPVLNYDENFYSITFYKNVAGNDPITVEENLNTVEKTADVVENSGETVEKTVEKTNSTVEKILEAIKANPKVTQTDLTYITGLTRRGVEYQISELKEKGIIIRIGPDKGGHWEVVEKE